MTDVTSADVSAEAVSDAHVPAAFERYTTVSLVAPTLIAGLLVAFDDPAPHAMTIVVWVAVVALWNQQLALLVRAGLLPRRRWSASWLPRWATGRLAVVIGFACALGLLVHGAHAGRAAWLWSLPYAVTLADALLAHSPHVARARRGRDARGPARPTARHDAALLAYAAAALAPVVVLGAVTRDVDALWPLAAVVLVGVVQLGQVWWLDVAVALERSRTTSVVLARTAERLRFAGELHDLQGAELQNIVTQADLALTLLRRGHPDDLARAEEAVAAVHTAAAGALHQTRAIAHGYRAVDLAQEVEGAAGVLAAAGVTLRVDGEVDLVPEAARRFTALVVREGTTNVLRHSAATEATLTVARTPGGVSVTVADPGPARPAPSLGLERGSGLASLAERAAGDGMRLEHGPAASGWRVVLHVTSTEAP